MRLDGQLEDNICSDDMGTLCITGLPVKEVRLWKDLGILW